MVYYGARLKRKSPLSATYFLCGFLTPKTTNMARFLVPFVVFLPLRSQTWRGSLCPLWFFYHEEHKDGDFTCALCGFFTTKDTKTAGSLCPLWFFYHKGHKESDFTCALCGFFTTKDTKKATLLVPFVVFLPQRTRRMRLYLCPLWLKKT